MATPPSPKRSAVKSSLEHLSESWRQDLRSAIVAHPHLPSDESVVDHYTAAFPPEYQATFSVETCVADLEVMSSLSAEHPLVVRIEVRESGEATAQRESPNDQPSAVVVLYNRGANIPLSKTLPILENAGLEVLTVSSFEIKPELLSPVSITRMAVKPKFAQTSGDVSLPDTVSSGLREVFSGAAENDALNALLALGPLDIEAISVLRAYSCLLWQLIKFATRGAIFEALVAEPKAAVLLSCLFNARFNPIRDGAVSTPELRTAAMDEIEQAYLNHLSSVREINRDRILRSLLSLVKHTVRTNFFHRNGRALALKLESEKIEIIPHPRPKFELFIRSPHFEGTHLRGDMVARGGIRWSERNDDYRTEVLGLMNTQRIKNVVIVPNGAKGGFAIRYLPKEQKELFATVERCTGRKINIVKNISYISFPQTLSDYR